MKSPTRWAILLAVFFIGFLIPELNGYFSGTCTLSQAVWTWSDLWWPFAIVAAFAVGVLFGHLFVPRRVRMLVLPEHPAVELFADAKDLKAFEEASRETKRRAF